MYTSTVSNDDDLIKSKASPKETKLPSKPLQVDTDEELIHLQKPISTTSGETASHRTQGHRHQAPNAKASDNQQGATGLAQAHAPRTSHHTAHKFIIPDNLRLGKKQEELLQFMDGRGSIDGMTLDIISRYDNTQLEDLHNYIQLLFPLSKAGVANKDYLLNDDFKRVLAQHENKTALQQYLKKTLTEMMLPFWGIKCINSDLI